MRPFISLFLRAAAIAALAVPSLRAIGQPLAAGHDKFLGCGTSEPMWSGLKLYWNQVTPGNDGKWGSVEGAQGQYNLSNLDDIYTFAVNNGIRFKEHTLVWGSQQPSWIDALDSASQRMAVANWINLIGQRYPSASFIDVVNEPFHSPPSYKTGLGGNGATGWDWVISAFQLARQYCVPGVKLLLNEYNILQDNTVTTNYMNLITLLKDRGLIDGIGIQGHYFEFRSEVAATSNIYIYDVNTIKANLNRLAGLGLPIYITEFDVDEPVDSVQLAQYKIYFPVFWTNPAVKGITFWGYIQNDVWNAHPNTYLFLTNGTERPALRWLRTFIATPMPPTLLSPVSTSGELRNPLLAWTSSAGANSYRVQVSKGSGFTSIDLDTVVVDTTVRISPLAASTRYYWHVCAANDSGSGVYSNYAGFVTGDQVSSVAEGSGKSERFGLEQNYPNPFNPTTVVSGQWTVDSGVRLAVYDLLGREVAVLAAGRYPAGKYAFAFDGTNLSSGVYFCRLTAGSYTAVRKMTLMK